MYVKWLKPFLLKPPATLLDDDHGTGASFILCDLPFLVSVAEHGINMQWGRAYQTCSSTGCRNWIWEDRIQAGFTCRLCGNAWQKPTHGFVSKAKQVKHLTRWNAYKARSPTPPPGLSKPKTGKQGKFQKAASDILAPAWEGLDEALMKP